jgi:hypothetical protein
MYNAAFTSIDVPRPGKRGDYQTFETATQSSAYMLYSFYNSACCSGSDPQEVLPLLVVDNSDSSPNHLTVLIDSTYPSLIGNDLDPFS